MTFDEFKRLAMLELSIFTTSELLAAFKNDPRISEELKAARSLEDEAGMCASLSKAGFRSVSCEGEELWVVKNKALLERLPAEDVALLCKVQGRLTDELKQQIAAEAASA